jgi:hypothetical protein
VMNKKKQVFYFSSNFFFSANSCSLLLILLLMFSTSFSLFFARFMLPSLFLANFCALFSERSIRSINLASYGATPTTSSINSRTNLFLLETLPFFFGNLLFVTGNPLFPFKPMTVPLTILLNYNSVFFFFFFLSSFFSKALTESAGSGPSGSGLVDC